MLIRYAVVSLPYLRYVMHDELNNPSLTMKEVVCGAAVLVALSALIHVGGMVAVALIGGASIGYVCAKIF